MCCLKKILVYTVLVLSCTGCSPLYYQLFLGKARVPEKKRKVGGVKIEYAASLNIYSKRNACFIMSGEVDNLSDTSLVLPRSLLSMAMSKDKIKEEVSTVCWLDKTMKIYRGDSLQGNLEIRPHDILYYKCYFTIQHEGKRFRSLKRYKQYLAQDSVRFCFLGLKDRDGRAICDTVFHDAGVKVGSENL